MITLYELYKTGSQRFCKIVEQEAQDAVNTLNIYYGIPTTPDAVTQTWCNYGYNGVYWYIVWDDSMNIVLGEPTEINVI